MDVKFTLKIVIIAIVAFLVITVWDEVLNRLIFDTLKLDKEKTSSWVVVGVISVILLLALLYVFSIEAHDVLGIGEAVDVQLTGKTERTVRGRIVHT